MQAGRVYTTLPQPQRWRAVRSTADPRVLVVVYLGHRDEWGPDEVVVHETGHQVEVAITNAGRGGYLAGVWRHVRVELGAPLAQRRVLDPSRQVVHEVFDGARLLHLTPPDGHRPAVEHVLGAAVGDGSAPRSWCELSRSEGGPALRLCHQVDAVAPGPGAGAVVVGQLPGQLDVPVWRSLAQQAVWASWLDPVSGHRVTLTRLGGLLPTADDPLLAAARGLRREGEL